MLPGFHRKHTALRRLWQLASGYNQHLHFCILRGKKTCSIHAARDADTYCFKGIGYVFEHLYEHPQMP